MAVFAIAMFLIIIGLYGLRWAKQGQTTLANASLIRVIDGHTAQTDQSRSDDAAQLQDAAGTKAFQNGREGTDVQKGGGIENLLKNKTIQ